MNQPTAEGVLRRLDVLVGDWTLEATWPSGESWPGRATFEWHPSRAHLVQHVEIDHPHAPRSLAIIGCDGAAGTYYQLYSDERGVCRVYEMTITDTELVLRRTGEPFAQRYVGTIGDGGTTITGRWEIAEDFTNYVTDFQVDYRKVRTE